MKQHSLLLCAITILILFVNHCYCDEITLTVQHAVTQDDKFTQRGTILLQHFKVGDDDIIAKFSQPALPKSDVAALKVSTYVHVGLGMLLWSTCGIQYMGWKFVLGDRVVYEYLLWCTNATNRS